MAPPRGPNVLHGENLEKSCLQPQGLYIGRALIFGVLHQIKFEQIITLGQKIAPLWGRVLIGLYRGRTRFQDFGPKFGCIPNAKSFPNSRQNIPNSRFFWGVLLFHRIQILNILQFHRIIEYNHTCFFLPFFIVHLGKFSYWNQSSIGSAMHKDHVKFPNFSQNSAYFPQFRGPPLPKSGARATMALLFNI